MCAVRGVVLITSLDFISDEDVDGEAMDLASQ